MSEAANASGTRAAEVDLDLAQRSRRLFPRWLLLFGLEGRIRGRWEPVSRVKRLDVRVCFLASVIHVNVLEA